MKPTKKSPDPAAIPLPRKRFRIDRLEERIAPKRGGNGTKNCGGGGNAASDSQGVSASNY